MQSNDTQKGREDMTDESRDSLYQRRNTADSWAALSQAIIAAVVVALVLIVVSLVGARLVPAATSECVMTDNAGCISVPARDGGAPGNAVSRAKRN